ncbi:transcription termination factor 2 isoform X1 [Anopheles maculipalpis]|uniref:transcription termination factor 2 isoform X1 n=1 Tax=Anopheles maculipalpis TaxID=1496333 RepID=UPI00215980AE|nr:transcription termination factor 2 isoform X1 [Anopheles maculipalpis]XP_050080080.1 transcription termination factor 2 isoform X1 [Anopheles maculipalpis]
MSAHNFYIEDSAEEDSFRGHKSFSKFREGESIVIEETDSEATIESSVNSSNSSAAVSEEENMVQQMKKRQSKRMSLHPKAAESESSNEGELEDLDSTNLVDLTNEDDDEEEEEEEDVEHSVYSPVTRMSIYGVAVAEGSDDDATDIEDEHRGKDDDVESGEEEIIGKPARKTRKKVFISDDESETSIKKTYDDTFDAEADEPVVEKEKSKLTSPLKDNDDQDSISTKLSSTLKSLEATSQDVHQDERNESRNAELSFVEDHRCSISMRASIGEKLSSTHIGEQIIGIADAKEAVQQHSSSDSSSIKLIEKSEEILTVSSGDEDEEVQFQGRSSGPKPLQQNLVQPTITSFVRGNIQQPGQRVSQSEYDSKVRRMADLKSQLVLIETVMKNSAKLPDKGAGLVRRLAEIKGQIFELAKDIEMTRATPSKGVKRTIQQNIDLPRQGGENSRNTSADSNAGGGGVQRGEYIPWDTIKKTTDDIQPRHTGKQGIATFENQKLLTMDRLATLHKSIETCPTEDTLADPPKLLRIELMDHQRHALAWMLWRETQKPRGGILADDMGLGKTLSMISLVLKSAELDPEGEQLEQRESDSENDEEQENQQPLNGGSWKSKGRKDYYAGGTLIVCPASLMRQWEGEITNRVKRNSLSVCVHHGTQRESKPRHLAKYDVVITTYNIVSRESKVSARGGDGVYGVNWERIILDEAHVIRNHKSNMSESCCGLKGRYRWLLTGTPIQNKEMDVYALMKFLRCTPFNDLVHWKRWIDNKTAGGAMRLNTIMKSIMLRRTKKQLQERGALTSLPNKTIEVIEVELEKDEMNVYQKVLMYSKNLFAQFLHQRAEKEHAMNYGYGNKRPTFTQRGGPNHAFDKVHQKLKSIHDRHDGTEVKQHQILVLLLRLRQICCHPGLIHEMLTDDDQGNLELSDGEDAGRNSEVDLLGQLNKLKLNDVIAEHEAKLANGGTDREDVSLNLSEEFDQPEGVARAASKLMLKTNPIFRLDRASSKIEKTMELLEEKIFHTDDKAIIVSQWTSMLDILGTHLAARNVAFVSLTGKVPVKLRNDIVLAFNKPSGKAKIMLLSLTAGGVGLNLVGANHLFLLDPHWNPQLEAQAQDRIYRVGQTKSVYIWKFMCAETVEQKIHALQQHKLSIADGVLTGTVNKGSKLTMDDLKSLFGL